MLYYIVIIMHSFTSKLLPLTVVTVLPTVVIVGLETMRSVRNDIKFQTSYSIRWNSKN